MRLIRECAPNGIKSEVAAEKSIQGPLLDLAAVFPSGKGGLADSQIFGKLFLSQMQRLPILSNLRWGKKARLFSQLVKQLRICGFRQHACMALLALKNIKFGDRDRI